MSSIPVQETFSGWDLISFKTAANSILVNDTPISLNLFFKAELPVYLSMISLRFLLSVSGGIAS